MSESKDYYKILGVNENASDKEIKQAFHSLAFKYHPDRPNGDEKKFKEINEAYQVLGNKNSRDQYDHMKKYGFSGNNFNSSGFNWTNFDSQDFGGFGDLGDIFGSFFNQSFNSKAKQKNYNLNQDISITLNISLAESYTGIRKNIVFEREVYCEYCNGLGHEKESSFKTCDNCKGKGIVEKKKQVPFFGTIMEKEYCNQCDGKGKIPTKKCQKCKGQKYILETKNELIDIPMGIRNFDTLEVRGFGNYQIKSKTPGSLYIKTIIKKDEDFWREGDNLCFLLSINFIDAILGCKKEIKNIDNKKLIIEIPKGVDHGAILKIRNKGFKKINQNGFGDLLITIKIKMPKKLSKKAENILEQLKRELEN